MIKPPASNPWFLTLSTLLAVLLPTAALVSQAAVLCNDHGGDTTAHVELMHTPSGCDTAHNDTCPSQPHNDQHPPCNDTDLAVDQLRPSPNDEVATPALVPASWHAATEATPRRVPCLFAVLPANHRSRASHLLEIKAVRLNV